MGDYGDLNKITQEYIDHIEGRETRAHMPEPATSHGPLDVVDINLAASYGTCRLCQLKGMEETPFHLVLNCPYTWRGRADLFGEYDPSPETFANWDPADLAQFFARYDLENLTQANPHVQYPPPL